jgi:hypothetical protein
MIRVPSVLFWFCVEMTVCVVMGVLIFQHDITPLILAVYAVTSLVFALIMSLMSTRRATV